MRIAALDIGTNSVLLLVAEPARAGGDLAAVHEECVITRLGQGVDRTGALDPRAIERTLAALGGMAEAVRRLGGVERIGAVGTSALRDARDARVFLERAAALLGCEVEVVSGRREAELVLGGVRGGLPDLAPRTLVFDVGGGSTELVLSGEGRVVDLVSLELGAVRLTERFLRGDPPAAREVGEARRSAREALGTLGAAFGAVQELVGVAGTVTTLATMKHALAVYDTRVVNGSRLTRSDVAGAVARLEAHPLEERRRFVGLEPARADILLGGALVVEAVLERFGAEFFRVCDRGVRWGLVRELAARRGGA
jgi:exopolyphosphatase / guanosine-5'-triphosphate,3'-diphosphate pyrophosphatase